LFASNTPHIVFEAVQRQSPIPLLSIVEVTRDAAATLGLTRVGLFGTRFTMRGGFYPEVFRNHGITVVVPGSDDLDYIHDKYIQELLAGVVREGTRERFLAIAEGLRQQEGIQGLILGGTELPFLLRDSALPGVPFLDTTRIHAERAVQEMLAG
jgi:aspartate racemase